MKLTPRQQRFVEEYLVDFNGKQAAIRAGYAPHTADITGSQLLALPKVKARVDWAIANRVNRIQVRQDDVVRELLRLANVNVAHAFAPDGKLLPIHEIPEDVQRAISTLEFETRDGETYVKRLRFWSKTDALNLLARHLGFLADRDVKQEGGFELRVLVAPKEPPKEIVDGEVVPAQLPSGNGVSNGPGPRWPSD